MITLRQLKALHWIARLGTFERAADRLNTTQSAISKRVHELEFSVGRPIFDRSGSKFESESCLTTPNLLVVSRWHARVPGLR